MCNARNMKASHACSSLQKQPTLISIQGVGISLVAEAVLRSDVTVHTHGWIEMTLAVHISTKPIMEDIFQIKNN